MKIDLTGRMALITGATGDLGRVMVTSFAACGADVVVHFGNNKAKADALVESVRKMGRRAAAFQADVCNPQSIEAMATAVRKDFGDPDIIVNGAVIQYKPWATVLEQPYEDYEGQYRSSVIQNVAMAKAFAPAMIAKKWGRIIGINTECSLQTIASQSAYTSGKHGMNAVLRCLSREIGQHQITVNQVAPGWMISDRDRSAASPIPGSLPYTERQPMKRRGTDQDIANLVVFLASDLAGYISGAFIPVDGAHQLVGI